MATDIFNSLGFQEQKDDPFISLGFQADPEKKPGFVQSVIQGAAKPFLKLTSSVSNAAANAVGVGAKLLGNEDAANRIFSAADEQARQGTDYGYLGKVVPFGQTGSAGRDLLEAVGTGAEIGSYAIGGGGAGRTIATGLGGKILRGAAQGVGTGAAGGATMSFGQALQDAEAKSSDVAMRTLFGGAVGGATGGALGAIAPVVVKGVNVAKRFSNLEQINTELQNLNTQVFKPTPKQLEKWSVQGKDPIKTYTEIFGTDIPMVGKDNHFTRESISDAVQRVDDIYKPAAEAFNTILRNSPEVNSLSKAEADAIKNLTPYNLTPEMEQKAIQKIQSNFVAIKDKAIKDGVLLGEDSIPVAYTDNLKDRFWAATKNFGTEDATIANSVNSAIGHGFKDAIENSIQDVNVKAYNKHLGDLIVLRDFLETKAGALSGTGGKMTRLMARVVGTVAGSNGGVIGSIMGNITGDKLAQILINPAYQPYRWLISKKLQQLPQTEVLRLSQEANQVIENMLGKRGQRIGNLDEMLQATRRALPEAPPRGTAKNPIITPNTKGTPNFVPSSKSAVAINSGQPLKTSANIEPTINPTINTKTNPISKNLNTQGGFIKGADGGKVKRILDDDKRVMKDFTDYVAGEMGNLTGKEIQELELAASRIAEHYNIKGFKTIKGLANEFGRILDDQGLSFGKIVVNPLVTGAGLSAAGAALAKLLKKKNE